MPNGDGTGPMAGRGAGYCAGFAAPGRMNGAGFGGGTCGMGCGRRRMRPAAGMRGFSHAGAPGCAYGANAKAALQTQAEALQARLAHVQRRMAELDTQAE